MKDLVIQVCCKISPVWNLLGHDFFYIFMVMLGYEDYID